MAFPTTGFATKVPPGSYNSALIILLTDGANVQGPSPAQAAEKAADLGVRIFTIGVGNPTNAPGQQGNGPSSGGAPSFGGPPGGGGPQFGGGGSFGGRPLGRFEVDETTLKGIAETTDGEYYLATDANALKQVYRDLNSQLVFTPQKTEVTFYFTAAGALFLIGATALSILWFSRIP